MAKKKDKTNLIIGTILIIIGAILFKEIIPLGLVVVGAYLIYKYYKDEKEHR